MNYDTYTLGAHNGQLCVVWHTRDWKEPLVRKLYWPIGNQSLSDWESYLGNPMDDCRDIYGNFCLRNSPLVPPFSMARQVSFRLIDGPQTKPIHSESEPIPKPLSRCECWYSAGQWHKRTARGIVSC